MYVCVYVCMYVIYIYMRQGTSIENVWRALPLDFCHDMEPGYLEGCR